MKLVSLNTWCGRAFAPLMSFIKESADATDIFCFQEVITSGKPSVPMSPGTRSNLFEDMQRALPEFKGYYARRLDYFNEKDYVDFPLAIGNVIFVKNGARVIASGDIFLYGERDGKRDDIGNYPVNLFWMRIAMGGQEVLVTNVHGITYPGDKLDSPARLAQSEKIKKFLRAQDGKKILCGDFNLMPATKSITTLEEDLTNLIKTFDVKSTRSRAHNEAFPGELQNFADYTFVSKDVRVIDFRVPQSDASDHLPMILEFE